MSQSANIIAELNEITENVKQTFGKLSAEQLNFKPSAESWSVGQCFEHLILTNNQMLELMEKVADGTHQNSFLEKWSPLTSFFGRLLVKSLKSDDKKFKAPSKTIVPPSSVDENIIQQFAENNAKVIDILGKIDGADWQKTVITSPFTSLMTYKLADGVTILVEHERRHCRQAERVLSNRADEQVSEYLENQN